MGCALYRPKEEQLEDNVEHWTLFDERAGSAGVIDMGQLWTLLFWKQVLWVVNRYRKWRLIVEREREQEQGRVCSRARGTRRNNGGAAKFLTATLVFVRKRPSIHGRDTPKNPHRTRRL